MAKHTKILKTKKPGTTDPTIIINLSYTNTQSSNYQFWVSCPVLSQLPAQLGYAMVVGDIDGDSKQDVVISAPATNRGAGQILLFYDPISRGLFNPSTGSCVNLTKTADATFVGDPGDWAGYSLAIGDMNGGGNDIAVGIPQRSLGPAWPTGKVVVIPGSNVRYSGIYLISNVSMLTIYGEKIGDQLGTTVAIGQLTNTNPNKQDLVTCAPGYPTSNGVGKCYLIQGGKKNLPSVIYLNQTQPQDQVIQIFGINEGDYLGTLHGLAVGNRKIFLGAPFAYGGAGEVYVIPADSGSLPSSIYLSNYTNLGILYGDFAENVGRALDARDNDVNGDGFPDAAIGTQSNSNLLYGHNQVVPPIIFPNVTLSGGADQVFLLTRPGAKYADLFIGYIGANNNAGEVYGIPGSSSLSNSNLTNSPFILNGANPGDNIGYALNALYPPSKNTPIMLLVGAPFADPLSTGSTSGLVYGVTVNGYTSAPTPAPTPTGASFTKQSNEGDAVSTSPTTTVQEQGWLSYAVETISNITNYTASFFGESSKKSSQESFTFSEPSAKSRNERRLVKLQEMQAKLTTLIEAAGNNPVLLNELFEHEDQLIAWNENVEAIKTEELNALNSRIEALEQKRLRSASASASTAASPFRFLPPPRITTSPNLPMLGPQPNFTLSQ